jgi:hypothetical protein
VMWEKNQDVRRVPSMSLSEASNVLAICHEPVGVAIRSSTCSTNTED